MLATIQRKLVQRRRELARAPLVQLILWAGYHALAPHVGRPLTAPVMDALAGEVLEALHRLADTGVLWFFGIRDSAELGDPPVSVYVVSAQPWGQTEVDADPIAEWILNGGARARGWMSPRSMTDDLLR